MDKDLAAASKQHCGDADALPEPDRYHGWTALYTADQLRTAIAAERAKADALRTVMIAAAEEIAAHWDAHCDAEGYGPQNLIRRLEEGIPSEYGYTAGRFAELQADLSTMRQQLAEAVRDVERMQFMEKDVYMLDAVSDPDSLVQVWVGPKQRLSTGRTVRAAIDAAIAAQGEAKPPAVERELFDGE